MLTHFSPTELTLEPQLPDKDFREKSEQPAPLSEHDQTSCRVLEGETSDEVQLIMLLLLIELLKLV